MPELVWLEGKHTAQRAHCALHTAYTPPQFRERVGSSGGFTSRLEKRLNTKQTQNILSNCQTTTCLFLLWFVSLTLAVEGLNPCASYTNHQSREQGISYLLSTQQCYIFR